VMRRLAKAPQSRWQNTGELACALLPWAPRRSHTVAERAVTRLKAAGVPISSQDVQVPSYRPPPGTGSTKPSSASDQQTLARTTPAVVAPPSTSTGNVSAPVSTTTGEPVSTGSTVAPGPPRGNSLVFGAAVAAIALALGGVAFVKFKPKPGGDATQ